MRKEEESKKEYTYTKRQKKFKINKLYKIALEYVQRMTDESEIATIDMTEKFFDEIEQIIKNGEILIAQIWGKVRLGKSTAGIVLGQHTFKLLKKYNQRKPSEKFDMKNIARDQQEKSKLMRDPKTQFTVIVTDESNELEKGGENSSAESALNKVFSDVQAGRYVHSISICPKEIIDNNADIMLEVVGVDKQTRTTHLNLYYRLFRGGSEVIQYLGYVNIECHDLIKNWEDKVKKVFLKPEKTKKEENYIKKWAEKDFYVEYMIKKYEKMELITKEGVFRPRLLDYSTIILEVIERLKKLTVMGNILDRNTVSNYVKIKMREHKIPTSIVGEELATRECMGVINLWKSYHKVRKEWDTVQKKRDSYLQKGAKTEQLEEFDNLIDQRKEMIKEIQEAITIQMNEYKKYKEINERYNEHHRRDN